jgi:hypothetical protein
MPSFLYNRGAELMVLNDLDLESITVDCRLVMSNTTVDTERDKLTLSGFTTIDLCDGASYGGDKTLASKTITRDDVNNRIEFDADNITWTALGAGTRTSVGILIYQDLGGGDATSVPIAYVEFPTAETHDGSDFPIQWNATYGVFYHDLN